MTKSNNNVYEKLANESILVNKESSQKDFKESFRFKLEKLRLLKESNDWKQINLK